MTDEELLKQIEADGGKDLADAMKAAMDEETDPQEEADNADEEAVEGESAQVEDKPKTDKPADKSMLDRVWTRIQERITNKDADPIVNALTVEGNHFLAIYSNNFKDRDGEFFPEGEIDHYIQRVDMGLVPKPELQVWHGGKAATVGIADWVARHGHFTLSAGTFYGSAAALKARDYYAKHAKDTGISHGFTYAAKDFDGVVYKRFNTFEISLLPRGAEANWYTSLEGVKELVVDEKKKQYLEDVFGKEHAARILADWDQRGKALEALDVEFKDFTGAVLVTETATKEAAEKANQSFTALVPDLIEGSAEAVTAALEAVKEVKALRKAVAELKTYIDARKAERPKRASQADETELDPEDEDDKAIIDEIQKENSDAKAVKAFPGFYSKTSPLDNIAQFGNPNS